MNARSRQARRIIRQRSAFRGLNRGRSLATHVLAAGTAPEDVPGVVNGLRTVARREGVAPVRTRRTHRTLAGPGRLRTVNHYTAAQVRTLAAAYRPRKAQYVAAKRALTGV